VSGVQWCIMADSESSEVLLRARRMYGAYFVHKSAKLKNSLFTKYVRVLTQCSIVAFWGGSRVSRTPPLDLDIQYPAFSFLLS